MSSSRHGGHVVAEVLASHGVAHVFGMDSPEAIFEALDPGVTRSITVRDERSGGFAADGMARVTGRPGVACGIHGGGVTNLVTPMLEAYAASSPLVVLGSDVDTSLRELNVSQDADHVALTRPVVKWAFRVDRPDRIGWAVDRALRLSASGRPGPVFVALPDDVMAAPQGDRSGAVPEAGGVDAASPAPPEGGGSAILRVAEMLLEAERPALLVGNGARIAGAGGPIVQLAERFGAALTVTALGRGAIDEMHPLFAGVPGPLTCGEGGSGVVANAVLREADLVLVLGSGLGGANTDGWLDAFAGALVHIDIDPAELGRLVRPSVGILGDVGIAVDGLLAAADGDSRDAAPVERDLAERWSAVDHERHLQEQSDAEPIGVPRLFAELRQVLDGGSVVVTDASYSSLWTLSHLRGGRDFSQILYGRGAGTLGFGFSAAMGAKLARPDANVVAVVGDGGFGYSWSDLEVAARERIAVLCVVLNNGVFGWQKHLHSSGEARRHGAQPRFRAGSARASRKGGGPRR